jgi:hypothetical protein
MSTELYRKYIDIINENSQDHQQLNEGLVDKMKGFVPKLIKMLGSDAEALASKVKEITGGDFSLTADNAKKIVQGMKASNVDEGIAGNWQGKLIQALYSLGILGSGAAAIATAGQSPWAGPAAFGIAVLLLMFANTFFSSQKGMVGAMGKHGNKGFSTDKGPEDNDQ